MGNYAVNLCDLMELRRVDPVGMLLFPKGVISDQVVYAEGRRMDAGALVLQCDNEKSEAILKLIRIKYRKTQLRIYYSKTGNGGWKRV